MATSNLFSLSSYGATPTYNGPGFGNLLPLTQGGGYYSGMSNGDILKNFAEVPGISGDIGVGGGSDLFSRQSMFGDGKTGGWAAPAMQGAAMLGNLFMGMRQYGLMKDSLNFQKDSFNKQYEALRNLTNSQLEDRQRARVAANPNMEDPASYMARWGVK